MNEQGRKFQRMSTWILMWPGRKAGHGWVLVWQKGTEKAKVLVSLKGRHSKRFMDKSEGANDLPRLGIKALWVVRVTL